MSKLQWTTVQKKVNDLVPQKVNPRSISPKQMEDLKKSIEKMNLVEIPAIDLDGKILAGHMRVRAMQLLNRGDEVIDVRQPNRKLTEKEANRYLISSNSLGGDWDFEKLKSFEIDLLTDIGFNTSELTNFWDKDLKTEDDNFDEKKELAKIKIPQTKLGDLVLLGDHKILCADSTDLGALKKLFGKEKASMIYSDPVYNLNFNYKSGLGGSKNYGGEVNDHRTEIEYKEFLRKSIANALSIAKDDLHIFYWSDQTRIGVVQDLYRELNIENKRVCLWLKQSQNPTPQIAFSKCYEPCTYGLRGRPYIAKNIQNLNEVMNGDMTTGNDLFDQVSDHLDIWAVRRMSGKEMEHATSKPVQLHTKAIRRCTKIGDIILDSFLGSASTLICAESHKRKVYGVELQPIYVDLAIRRWEKLTGRKAKIIKNYYEKA